MSEHGIDRDELLSRTELTRLLDTLTTGTGDGHRRRWSCPDPDHPDVHPSVTVHTDQRGIQRWRCWSGGHGGTAIDAIVVARRLGIGEAIRWLADHHAHLPPIERRPPRRRHPIGQPAPEVVEYVERCAKLLWAGTGGRVRDWLNLRGYDDEILALNKIGADPGRRYLPRPKGFPSGWPAAVYPALDPTGAITYFQARYLDPPAGRGKYDNPASRWATNPRLGWIRPAQPLGPDRPLIVTEGIADAIAAGRLGYGAVGVLGTGAPDRESAARIASVVRRRASSPVVCFDADHAGRAAASRIVAELAANGIDDVEVCAPPDGMDLTDWIASDPRSAGRLLGASTEVARDLDPSISPSAQSLA